MIRPSAKCFILNPPTGGCYNDPHFIDEESLSLSKADWLSQGHIVRTKSGAETQTQGFLSSYENLELWEKPQGTRGKKWNLECLQSRLRVPWGMPPWSDFLYSPLILGQPKSSRALWVLTLKPDRALFSRGWWSRVLLLARAALPCPATPGALTQPVGLL